jgi:pSer/pThr/pTyr-binding forkhead associated (FHA) protein
MSRHTPHTDQANGGLDQLPTVVNRAPAPAETEEVTREIEVDRDDTRPVLLLTRGPDAGRRLAVGTDTVTVLGRHADCDLVLPDVTVSRRHAEIRHDGESFVLTDIGSLNGTYVNQHPVDTVVLTDGDTIAVGIFRFRFHAGAPTGAPVSSAADRALV